MAIEELDYKYTGCYGCEDKPQGYIYEYDNGKKYFRCGHELICLPKMNVSNISEICELFKNQHDYYIYIN